MRSRSVLLPIITVTCRAQAVSTFRRKRESKECNDAYINYCTKIISHSSDFKSISTSPNNLLQKQKFFIFAREKRNSKFSLLYCLDVGFITSFFFPSIPLTRPQRPKNQYMKNTALASEQASPNNFKGSTFKDCNILSKL